MPASTPNSALPSPWRRIVAIAGVALVLLLGASSVSPALHQVLHVDAHTADHTCAVVLFASGLTVAVGAVAVVPPRTRWVPFSFVIPEEILLPAPRYLRQPERGPPSS